MNWDAVSHGTPSLIFAYAITGVPMLIGLLQQRATFHRILTAPLIAILVTFAAVLAWTGVHFLWANAGVLPPVGVVYFTATIFLAGFGYMAGLLMGKARVSLGHQRGTLVEEGRRTRVPAGGLSLAGIPVASL